MKIDLWQEDGTIATISTMQQLETHNRLQVDDAVFVQQCPTLEDARAAGHCDVYPILKVFSKEEEDLLVTSGAMMPRRETKEGHNYAKKFLMADPPPDVPDLGLQSPSPSPPLQTKPFRLGDARDRFGRVMKVGNNRLKVEVDCESQGKILSHLISHPNTKSLPRKFRKLKVGTAVRCRQYSCLQEAALEDQHHTFIITLVYTKEEEEDLSRHGAVFPDVPPDLRPSGYYG